MPPGVDALRRLIGRRARLLALVAAGLALLVAAWLVRRWYRHRPIEVAPAADFRLGYNLDFPGDWTNLPPFIDQFKNARAMYGGCAESDPECDPTAHLDLDEQGWVRSLRYRDDATRSYAYVEVIFNTGKLRSDVGQPFVVTWQGQGEVEVLGAPDAALVGDERRITFRLPNDTALLRLRNIDPNGRGFYLRNVQIFRADHEQALAAGKVFNPELLDYLKPFESLRFMDWMQSNSPGRCSGGSHDDEACYAVTNEICEGGKCLMPGKWAERPTQDQATWIGSGQYVNREKPELGAKVGGYPLEVMVALANEAHASPHFNMPADSDDEYVQKFAEYVRDHLAPDLPVAVEYSNEVWNWSFPQATYAKERAARLWPQAGTGWVQYMALRTHNLCRLFHQVFAGQEQRLRCLISPQTGWRGMAEEVLDCPSWIESHPEDGSCTKYVDAINITGYFAGCLPSHPQLISRWLADGREAALNKAFTQLEHGGLIEDCEGETLDNLDYTIGNYQYFMQLAARRGLGLEVYEGGTHFDYAGDSAAVKQFLVDLTQDGRMQALYRRNFDAFRRAGGQTFNVWGWVGPNDPWANASSIVDRKHPKYRAIVEFAAHE
ncbi:MAG: hypothetical protein RL685_1147 [Pseudomonadota bacterium]|jgi:hypothetical protein